jgi:hypothetical protein
MKERINKILVIFLLVGLIFPNFSLWAVEKVEIDQEIETKSNNFDKKKPPENISKKEKSQKDSDEKKEKNKNAEKNKKVNSQKTEGKEELIQKNQEDKIIKSNENEDNLVDENLRKKSENEIKPEEKSQEEKKQKKLSDQSKIDKTTNEEEILNSKKKKEEQKVNELLKTENLEVKKTINQKLIEKEEREVKLNNQKELLANQDYSQITLRLNEILPNPESGGKEFIEIYNYGDEAIDLNNWKLKDKTTKQFQLTQIIQPGEYLAFQKGDDFKFALNNSNETVFLINPTDEIFSSVSYQQSIKGKTFNFDDENWYWAEPTLGGENVENPTNQFYPKIIINEIFPNPSGADGDQEFVELYNPNDEQINLTGWTLNNTTQNSHHSYNLDGFQIEAKHYLVLKKIDYGFSLHNTFSQTELISPNPQIKTELTYQETKEGRSLNVAQNDDGEDYWARTSSGLENNPDPKLTNYPNLVLSEILPNPNGDESLNEFIEIYNPNAVAVDLIDWQIKDSSSTGNYLFSQSKIIPAKNYLTIYRSEFDFALNNSGGEAVYLLAPNEKIKSQVEYQTAREEISYNFNFVNENWRWSRFLTPNKENQFNNLPKITKFSIDKKIYKKMYAEFEVQAIDLDNEKLQYRWDFGDGHRSYQRKTRHKYLKTGTYFGNVRIQDSSEEVVKNFTIKVKKYPKYKVEIIQVMPNPVGKDSINEFVVVKNNSKHKINLENWSVATATEEKKIINHPIHTKLIIQAGEEKKITRKDSAFSLPNKKGVVELRRPDGSVADKIAYAKNQSIKENEAYEKNQGQWHWVAYQIPISWADKLSAQEIVAQALANEEKLNDEALSQLVANRLVHQIKEKGDIIILQKSNWLDLFLTKINSLLNQIIPTVNNLIAKLNNKKSFISEENLVSQDGFWLV